MSIARCENHGKDIVDVSDSGGSEVKMSVLWNWMEGWHWICPDYDIYGRHENKEESEAHFE